MNQETFFQQLQTNQQTALALLQQKNHDYATTDDPYSNFRAVETLGLTVEQGILVRMSDKFSRLKKLLQTQENKVADETIKDTCIDLMNYTNILLTYLQSQ